MSVTVELTYDLAKVFGARRLEIDGAGTVKDVVRGARERFGEHAEEFERLMRVVTIAVNGVIIAHRRGMGTAVGDGDTVAFLKPAAGG